MRKTIGAIAAGAIMVIALAGTSVAADPDYATVTGYEAFSNEANQADYWGENCTKLDDLSAMTYVLTEDYAKVIVKAGSDQSNDGPYTNTIFAAPPKAGQTVWADTNGNGQYDETKVGDVQADKTISHIIFCPVEVTPPPEPSPSESASPSPSEDPSPTPTPSESPTPTPTPSESVEPSPTPTPTPATPTATPTTTLPPTDTLNGDSTGSDGGSGFPLLLLGLAAITGGALSLRPLRRATAKRQ